LKIRLYLSAALIAAIATSSHAQEAAPFSLKHYGNFKKMQHKKVTDGVVDLKQAISAPHTYGVGAPAHGTGEITIIDGKLWLDYGVDGLGNAVDTPAKDEQAVLLVTAEIAEWHEVTLPNDMNEDELHSFIIAQAGLIGFDAKTPFPFMLEGQYFDLDWHVLNGLKMKKTHSTAKAGGHKGVFKKVKEHQAEAAGKVVGFYSAAKQGVYTHPGESWHLHMVIEEQGKAGHMDAVGVRAGTVLKLPKV